MQMLLFVFSVCEGNTFPNTSMLFTACFCCPHVDKKFAYKRKHFGKFSLFSPDYKKVTDIA